MADDLTHLKYTDFGEIIEYGYNGGLSEGSSILAQAEAEMNLKVDSTLVERIQGYTPPALRRASMLGTDDEPDEPFNFPPRPEWMR